jgi:hypothetical protein
MKRSNFGSDRLYRKYLKENVLYCTCEEHSPKDIHIDTKTFTVYGTYDFYHRVPYEVTENVFYCIKCKKHYSDYNPPAIA